MTTVEKRVNFRTRTRATLARMRMQRDSGPRCAITVCQPVCPVRWTTRWQLRSRSFCDQQFPQLTVQRLLLHRRAICLIWSSALEKQRHWPESVLQTCSRSESRSREASARAGSARQMAVDSARAPRNRLPPLRRSLCHRRSGSALQCQCSDPLRLRPLCQRPRPAKGAARGGCGAQPTDA